MSMLVHKNPEESSGINMFEAKMLPGQNTNPSSSLLMASFGETSAIKPQTDDKETSLSHSSPMMRHQKQVCVEIQIEDGDECDRKNRDSRNCFLRAVTNPVMRFKTFFLRHKKVIFKAINLLLAFGITIYMIVALIWNYDRALPLLVVWSLVVAYKIYVVVRDTFGKQIKHFYQPAHKFLIKNMFWIKWLFISCVLASLVAWIAVDTSKRPNQLISACGYLIFIFGLFISSKYPDKVIWRPVLWGFFIQICFGMIILRTKAGFEAFNWIGNFAQTFINFIDAGAEFVFGETFWKHFVAFKVLPIVLYFGAFISVMYYLGVVQWLIFKMAWLMQISLNTSATESLVAAGNVFVGLVESPLLIRPYIQDLTTSELHAVMTAGLGTIAGSVLGAYLSFGIQAVYVITACFMAAPCALAVSKLVYPETKQSKFLTNEGLVIEKAGQRNIIEAAFVGASEAIPLVLNIGAVLIAFLSLLAALNGFLSWFGGLLNFPQLSFELICSYVFVPITFLMGIEWQDCFKAAELIGTKIFLNDFIAYKYLAQLITNRDNGTIPRTDPITGSVNWINERSEAIVTYSLCGFANMGSLGIMLGGLGAIAPNRQGEMASLIIRALIAGIFVSILNACVAGFLYVPRPITCDNMLLATANWTYTEPPRLHECCTRIVNGLYNHSAIPKCCNHNWNSTEFHLNCVF